MRNQTTRLNNALLEFQKHFKINNSANDKKQNQEKIAIISAPGRTEISGNHTDHQKGCVLAAAINLDILLLAVPNNSNYINLYSEGFGMQKINLDKLEKDKHKNDTEALIKGVAAWFKKNNYTISGFDGYLTSDVIVGSGLSSSAAFEIAIGGALNFLFNNNSIKPVQLALAGQYAENNYMNKASGLMDQTASAVGGFVFIDFKNQTKPIIKPIQFNLKQAGYDLCIVDVHASHADLTKAYSEIPQEMKMVAKFFGKNVLREVNQTDFFKNISKLRLKVGDRPVLRAIHFFNENQRVLEQKKYLETNNFAGFLTQVRSSGNSSYKYLQNIYAYPENQAISIGYALSEKILCKNSAQQAAIRVHGGGFAGTILAFVPHDILKTYKTEMEKIFGNNSCHVLQIRNTGVYGQYI
ncbi:MAG: hypothetical protein LBT91_03860 [Bifidobacteriaceae bacterium]|jgi:galactokinase|nr:hypothetical protein [Bifidobacteriaceae bacterium]